MFEPVEGAPGIITAGTSSGITDGGAAVVVDPDTFPPVWIEVESGHTYRFIIRVTDTAGQTTDSAPSDPAAVP